LKDTIFFQQANLLIDVLPILNQDKSIALKGGTAINFFIRDLPRLSVDIDLTYLSLKDRENSLNDIDAILRRCSDEIRHRMAGTIVTPKTVSWEMRCLGLIINRNGVRIKIEVNPVLRGSVFPCELRNLTTKTQDFFEKDVQSQCMSFADLYGGKICAALDRQHPRDLFDIKLLLENEGLTNETRKAFIIYLISHNRPMIELLRPNLINIKEVFEKDFTGMTFDRVALEELEAVRIKLINAIKTELTETEKQFILSVKSGDPDWNLFEIINASELPGIQWKLQNIKNMKKKQHEAAYEKLREYFEI
jgi:predicted nucleotidyltransferase component of viral defense system